MGLEEYSDELLRKLSADLVYESVMLRYASQQIGGFTAMQATPPTGVDRLAIDFSLSGWVEVLHLHARVLTDFFQNDPRGDDVVAGNFAPTWDAESHGGEELAWLQDGKVASNKRVMHFTAYRQQVSSDTDARVVDDILGRLETLFERFRAELSFERLAWFTQWTPDDVDS